MERNEEIWDIWEGFMNKSKRVNEILKDSGILKYNVYFFK